MAVHAPTEGRWLSSSARNSHRLSTQKNYPGPEPNLQQQQQPTVEAAPAPAAASTAIMAAPRHPVPQMQGAFEESMRETIDDDELTRKNPYFNANAAARRKLLLENDKYERTVAGRWVQKAGENFHPLWKLVAQISFGMHLLQSGLAKSDEEVIRILQTHVDDIDSFLERTTEDFDLAQQDINERIRFLRLPLEHGDVFDTMLADRGFRTAIVDGNEKIEHIVNRTTVATKDALKDIQKGLDGTRELARFLKEINRRWTVKSEEHAAVYQAMVGNTEGWNGAYKSLQQKGNELGISLVQLGGVISEIQRRAGIASRRNLPVRHKLSSRYSPQYTPIASAAHSPMTTSFPRTPVSHSRTSTYEIAPGKYLPTEPTTVMARSRNTKTLQAIELPADRDLLKRQSMQAQLVFDTASSHSASPAVSLHSRNPSSGRQKEDFANEEPKPAFESRRHSVSRTDPGPMTLKVPESQPEPQTAEVDQLEVEQPIEHSQPQVEPESQSEVRQQSQIELQASEPQAQESSVQKSIAAQEDRAQCAAQPPAEQTSFKHAVDATAPTEAGSSYEKYRSHTAGRMENEASFPPVDVADLGKEESVINRAHPLFLDTKAQEVPTVNTEQRRKIQKLSVRTSAETLSSVAQKSSFRESGSPTRQPPKADPYSSPVFSNRDSNNTMATPISMHTGDGDPIKPPPPLRINRAGEKKPLPQTAPPVTVSAAPLNNSSPDAKFSHDPPSPSLRELTSATVTGPEFNPFISQSTSSVEQRPLHQELIDRINSSLNDSTATVVASQPSATKSRSRHSRTNSETQCEQVQPASTTTTTTTVLSHHPQGLNIATSISRSDSGMGSLPSAPVTNGDRHEDGNDMSQHITMNTTTSNRLERLAANGLVNPSTMTTTTTTTTLPTPSQGQKQSTLSPFPSSTGPGSNRRPSDLARAQAIAAQMEANANIGKKGGGGFKKLFSISKGGKGGKDSLGNMKEGGLLR